MKMTIDEVKQSISPLVGSIQHGISSLNTGAGQLSSKLQEKAKFFQDKFSLLKKNTTDISMTEISNETVKYDEGTNHYNDLSLPPTKENEDKGEQITFNLLVFFKFMLFKIWNYNKICWKLWRGISQCAFHIIWL